MAEEIKNPQETGTTSSDSGEGMTEMGANDYVQAINEMKKKMVSREAYDQLKAENKTLIDGILNGGMSEQTSVASPEEQVDIEGLRKELFDTEKSMSNLEYVENALKLRQAIIDDGGNDPFVPWGDKVVPTQEDFEAAERVAKVFQECVDYAQGDSEVFTNELMRRTVDSAPMQGTAKRRK